MTMGRRGANAIRRKREKIIVERAESLWTARKIQEAVSVWDPNKGPTIFYNKILGMDSSNDVDESAVVLADGNGQVLLNRRR